MGLQGFFRNWFWWILLLEHRLMCQMESIFEMIKNITSITFGDLRFSENANLFKNAMSSPNFQKKLKKHHKLASWFQKSHCFYLQANWQSFLIGLDNLDLVVVVHSYSHTLPKQSPNRALISILRLLHVQVCLMHVSNCLFQFLHRV